MDLKKDLLTELPSSGPLSVRIQVQVQTQSSVVVLNHISPLASTINFVQKKEKI